MPEVSSFSVFLVAATLLAVVPGPGMLYVLARTLRGGRREGVLSTLGTGVAGLLHTLAAAIGVSALLATSALAFSLIKWLGAVYLVYLGIRTLLERSATLEPAATSRQAHGSFRQGVLTEVLNPKTALFFLAFIPQFIDPSGSTFAQFVLLGFLTTLLTSGADFAVVLAAVPLSRLLQHDSRLKRVQRTVSGGVLVGLGVYVVTQDR